MKFCHYLFSFSIYLLLSSQVLAQKVPQDIASFQKLLDQIGQLYDSNSKAAHIIIPRLEAMWPQATFPYRNFLQSILADEYYRYYLSRLQVLRESPPRDIDPDNFRTWNAEMLSERTRTLYQESLQDTTKLNSAASKEYKNLFVDLDLAGVYHPTLYRLLAQRALKFLEDPRGELHRGDQAFRIKSRQAFVEADSFVSLIFKPRDSLSTSYLAIKLYQNLLNHHQKSANPFPFVFTNIQRLKYARKRSTGQLQRQRYANALQQMADAYGKHPAVAEIKYELAKLYMERGQSYMPPGIKSFQWDYKAAWELCEEVRQKFPKTQSAKKCQKLREIIEQRTLSVDTEEVQLPEKPFRIKLNFRNINKVYIRIIPLTPTLNQRLDKLGENHEAQIALLQQQLAKDSWIQDLPNEEDFQMHAIELPMPELGVGKYILLVGDDAKLSTQNHAVAHTRLRVSQLAVIQTSHTNAGHFYVMDRETGRPLENVSVYKEGNNADVFTTNKEGKYAIDLSGEFKIHNLIFKQGLDSMEIQTRRRFYFSSSPKRRLLSRIYSDAKVYQPGSRVDFRGLAYSEYQKSFTAITDSIIYVRLINSDEEIVRDTTVKINEYGAFSGSFILPKHETGHYMLISQGASFLFQIKEAEPEHFDIHLKAEEKDYEYWDTVFVKGRINPFVGADMPETTVQYRVIRQSLFPYWYSYSWWRPEPQNERVIAARGKTSTDSSGRFRIPFLAIPDLELGTDAEIVYNYTIYAEANSLAGEEHGDTIEVRIGRPQLAVNLDVPIVSNIDQPLKVKIETKSLNGKPRPVQGRLRIFPLEVPTNTYRERQWSQPDMHILDEASYHDLFPHDVYGYEDDFRSWRADTAVVDTMINTATDSILLFSELTQQLAGQYRVRFDTEDPYGNPLKVIEYATRYNSLAPLQPIPNILSYSLSQLEAQPGDKVQLGLFTSSPDLWVLLEWGTQEKIDTSMLIRMEHFRYNCEIPIKASHKGNVMLRISTVIHNEFHSFSQTIEVPWKEKMLVIEEAHPQNHTGESSSLTLKIQPPNKIEILPQFLYTHFSHLGNFPISIFPRNRWIGGWESKGFSIAQSGLVSSGWRTGVQTLKLSLETPEWRKNQQAVFHDPADLEKLENDIWASERSRMAPIRSNSGRYPSSLIGIQHDFKSRLQTRYVAHLNTKPRTSEKINRSYQTSSFYPSFTPSSLYKNNDFSLKYAHLPLLGKWKLRTIAHTADLQTGIYEKVILIQQPIIGHIRQPAFLDAGKLWDCFVRVYNFSEEDVSIGATLSLKFYRDGETIKETLLSGKSVTLQKENGVQKLHWPIDIVNDADSLNLLLDLSSKDYKLKQDYTIRINQMSDNQKVKDVFNLENKLKIKTIFPHLIDFTPEKLQSTQNYIIELSTAPSVFAVPHLQHLYQQTETDIQTTSQRLLAYHALRMFEATDFPKDHAEDLLRLLRKRQTENGSLSWQPDLDGDQQLTIKVLQKLGWIQEWLAPNWRQQPIADSLIFPAVHQADSILLGDAKDIEEDTWEYLKMRAFFKHIDFKEDAKNAFEELLNDSKTKQENFSIESRLILAKLYLHHGDRTLTKQILASISLETASSQPNFMEIAALWTTLSYQVPNDQDRGPWVTAVLNRLAQLKNLSNEERLFASQVLVLTPQVSPSIPSFKLKVGKQKKKMPKIEATYWKWDFGKEMDKKSAKIKLKTLKSTSATIWGQINWVYKDTATSPENKYSHQLTAELQRAKSRMLLHIEAKEDLHHQTLTYSCYPEIVPEPSKRKIDLDEQTVYLENDLSEIKVYVPYLAAGKYLIEVPLVE